ncbi:hypothetical protein [Acanthopleuribacter pedis]|uniref:Uncharacterized protein n=1 Tax=Acanthopleuribacter pedis TaxID=442870 RepID=A0A8J7QH80_9BACT|nr:hypothetical protein [Acanthopleuribacter pedis]MBO1320351.1 hypothetical protein [Acanthopleuribacter pedis]
MRCQEPVAICKLQLEAMDTNEMLRLGGVYRLAQVCRHLIFEPYQLRREAKRHSDARNTMGVFFHKPKQAYLVDMPVFSAWLSDLWLGRPR